MSRAFTRALVISTISGIAVAPAIAFAAGSGSNAPAPTVTTLIAPNGDPSGHGFTLTARVAPSTATGNSARHAESEVTDSKAGKGKKGGTTGRKGTGRKGKGKSSGKGHSQRHSAETGSVTFVIDGKSLKPVPLARGRAAEKIDLPPGNHTAAASYSGDNNYRASQSVPISFTVK
jgi:hypothetical protein